MQKEKCFREINDTLAKTISQSILKQFASNLGVEIYQGQQLKKQVHKTKEHDKQEEETNDSADVTQTSSRFEALTDAEIDKQNKISEFIKLNKNGDDRGLTKLIKSLTTETSEDIHMLLRQKNGQLRFGDVITLNFQKDIFDSTQNKQHPVNLKFQKVNAGKREQKNLFEPDYTYQGLLYSDGVTDRGINMIPKTSKMIQNACNMFKQCLFRIEVLQACDVNKRRKNLIGQKKEQEMKLKQLIKDKGGEQNVKPEMILQIKKDLEKVDDEIIENDSKQIIEQENNHYQQEYNRGKKLTYGTPIQLFHIFSGKYLTLNLNQMSSEHGSCELQLHQSTDLSQFLIEPSEELKGTAGQVVSYQDYFVLKSMNTSTPFSCHVFEKNTHGHKHKGAQKQFCINASIKPSMLKAKLFMSFKNAEREKSGIQSGDVIRLRSYDADGYLTNQSINVDTLLPCLPDFLKNQMRRMNDLEKIEGQVGGKDKNNLSRQERKYMEQDALFQFKIQRIDDEYIKQIKTKSHEHLFVEAREDRLRFTNSCWEIQRVNPLMGANLILEEIVRFRHVGTGKFLCIDQNNIDLTMTGSSNNLDTLFVLKSDMSNRTATKFLDADGDGIIDDPNFISANSRVLVQSWKNEKYLQLVGDIKKDNNKNEEEAEAASSDEDLNLVQEDLHDSQCRVASGDFQKQDKNRMIFYIEEVDTQESIHSYQCACMFDELLEFYCFMNQFGIAHNDNDDLSENFYFKHSLVVQNQDLIRGKVEKILFILTNIEIRISESTLNQRTNDKLIKCKNELSDQGILDVLFCIIEMLYYKSTPPNLFEKVFKDNSMVQKEKDATEMKHFKIGESYGQQIIRDECWPLLSRIFGIILNLVDEHQENSEKSSKYFGILLQQFRSQDHYKKIQQIYPNFKMYYNPDDVTKIIGQIFINSQRDSTFVLPDRNLHQLIVHQENFKQNKKMQKILNKGKHLRSAIHQSKSDINLIEDGRMGDFLDIEKSVNPKLMIQWTQLLQPLKYINNDDQNIANQILYINILRNFCIDRAGKGVYPYQKYLTELILEDESKFLLKFGTAKVDGALRPYVYFERPKGCTRDEFLRNNPILAKCHDTGYMTQHNNQKAQYDTIFDINSLTKQFYFNDDSKGQGIKLYVEYICAVVNLYSTMCLQGMTQSIDLLGNVGLSESHISLVLHKDSEKLIVHEKFKAAYCFLARTLYIENDTIVNCIENKNRCYVWDRIKKKIEIKDQGFSQKDFNDLVVNDEYAGKTKTKVTQLDDSRSQMIILTEDQKQQNKMVISLIKESCVWFLLEGPKGTTTFFYHNTRRNFMPASLEIKVSCVLEYLNTIYSVVNKDFLDPIFIENIQLICQCCLYGSLHRLDPQEQEKLNGKHRRGANKKSEENIPIVIKSNWLYNLMWISKDIVSTNPGIFLEKYNEQIECKALDILDKLTCHKLNTQLISFLSKFRQFQETSLDQGQLSEEAKIFDVESEFENIFQVHQSEYQQQEMDKVRENQHQRMHSHADTCNHSNCQLKRYLQEFEQEDVASTQSLKNEIFLNYIFDDNTKSSVRTKALEVIIQEFNQKELLVTELMKTSLIVSNDDYHTHIKFLLKQRQLKCQIQKMLHNEIIWTIQEKGIPAPKDTVENKKAIMKIISELGNDIKGFDIVKKRGFQNMIRHIGLIEQLNQLMVKLKDKMFYYRDLYQEIIDFLYIVCFNNPVVQGFLIQDLNFFVDMINNRIETGILISEIIKCNLADSNTENFIKYLINKIINEGYFKSTLFYLLIKLADGQSNSNDEDNKIERNKNNESSNQQYIMKQIVKNQRFRSLIYMKPEFTATKLGIISSFIKRLDHAKEHDVDLDNNYKREKELLDMHLAVIDLLSICAKNSPYGISQAQKLINCEELLNSILSDAIPYLVKRHYFNLLFEVYLRKVPGVSQYERLQTNNLKLQAIFQWVICWDLDQCYNHYSGLVIDNPPEGSVDANKKFRQVNREVQRQCEQEFENKFIGKTDEQRSEEIQTRSKLQAFSDTHEVFFLDNTDLTEYWRYLYESTEAEGSYTGLLSFIELFYLDYTSKDFDNDVEAQKNTMIIKQKLLEMASNIFLIQDTHDDYIKIQSQQILVQINRSVQQMPNFDDFPALKKDGSGILETSQASQQVDARMCGDKIIQAIGDYIVKENTPIREALGISNVSSENTMVSKESLKNEIKLICGSGATYDDVVKALNHFHDVSLARKMMEAGPVGYMVEEELGNNLVDIVDIEIRLRDFLAKQGRNADVLGQESSGVMVQETIHDQDLSNAINIDLKLFSQRFFEFVRGTKNFSEIHMFVHDLMGQEYTKDRESKVQLVRSLLDGFTGLSGDNDELILISILSLIIQRLIPDEEDSLQASNQTLLYVKKNKKHNDRLKQQLKEWQDIMFEAEVPALMLTFINVNNDPYLSNKALGLLNNILIRTNEKNQEKIIQLLKKDDCFFSVFYYLMMRMQASKDFMLQQIQKSAEQKFMDQNLKKKKKGSENKQNDFQNPSHLLNMKYDLEVRYKELTSTWLQEEMYEILKFLNSICEGCYEPAQMFLGRQQDDEENFKNQKKITSIDLIFEVQRTFIDIVDTMGDYVFSDFRTFKLIPLMMDTMLEFIYGPCVTNQVFLGESKKFISVINTLIDQAEMGNYSGIHQQAKAQLVILNSCTQLLLAICDIKHPEKAARTHQIILNEINIPNLIKKMKDIYIFKVGGDPERQLIYDFNQQCNHYKSQGDEGKSRCLEDEFCEFKYLIPRDINTIQTGFNIYMFLTILKNNNENRKEIACFKRNEGEYNSLVQKHGKILKNRIYDKYKMSSDKTKNIYEKFNKIEVVLLDQMIIKSFPELYITYIEKTIEEQKEDPNQQVDYTLKSNLEKAKSCKNKFDQQQILQKLPAILRKNYTDGTNIEENNDQGQHSEEMEASISNMDNEEKQLIEQQESYGSVDAFATPGGEPNYTGQKVTPVNDQNKPVNNKVNQKISTRELYQQSIKMQELVEEQLKLTANVDLFEFYLAGNFYEDNIGTVEIQLEECETKETFSPISIATFQIPSFIKHLTQETRDKIPTALNGVSQQEKLEQCVQSIPVLLIEMKWQQRLGRVSYALKIFANQWNLLAWINFYIIVFINIMLIAFFKVEPVEDGRDSQGNQIIKDMYKIPNQQINEIVNDIGLIQSAVAMIVVFAYYIEYRAKLKYLIQESKQSKNVDLSGYGVTYGSQGYGNRKSLKLNDVKSEQLIQVNPLKGIENKSIVFKILMIVTKEISMFVKAMYYDNNHRRNIFYVLLSIFSNLPDNQYANSLLLLDLIKKVETLGQVILVITDNALALSSTLVLFVVLLYYYSFLAFRYVRDDYRQNYNTGSNFYQNHAPVTPGGTYNMDCSTLVNCLFSTTSFGMRSGGGVGDALWQRYSSDEFYEFRYVFDFTFFMIINIILMNIFFGIIIDSFADKRSGAADIESEVQGICFICGISKSKFEIENIPWHDHIYTEHNLHSYYAFIIYVQGKNMSECSGVEKWVKKCLEDENIYFFPVQRCLSINNGQEIE